MLSNFGLRDGGRETWAYNFIPRLLERHPDLRLRVYGLRVEGQQDHGPRLTAAVADADRGRLSIDFVRAKANAVPNPLYFWSGLRRLVQGSGARPPAYVVAVGSFIELLAVLLCDAFRDSTKVVWLRTILVDEKAHRVPPMLRPLLRRLEDRVLRRADIIIANGDDTGAHYRARGLKVEVIRNAVDFHKWHRPAAHPVEPPLNVAYIGRLAPHKGIQEFLKVAESFRAASQPKVQFHVVGEGGEQAQVERAAGGSPLIYHGAVANDRLPELLGTFDACVALSFQSEHGGTSGVSNALLEQMAAGRIIIGWRNAIFEQILDDDSAYLAEQGSVDRLREALASIAEQPDKARAKAVAAQEIARAHGFDMHMDKFDRLIAAHFKGAGR